ncbi:hypothetical protein CU044_7292 [Streptomyces sp. L-9-10]|nr:hypothetical protein CU044_7292 [Streptomyces sp. L-9-10]
MVLDTPRAGPRGHCGIVSGTWHDRCDGVCGMWIDRCGTTAVERPKLNSQGADHGHVGHRPF